VWIGPDIVIENPNMLRRQTVPGAGASQP
jgi:hypothetical protein